MISKGQYLAASDALNTILEESPGMDEARDQLDRATRLMAGRLKRGKFPTVQHQAAWEGLVFYNRADFEPAARSLRLALSAGSIPPDLTDARVENYALLAEKKLALTLWRQERQILLLKAENARKDGDLATAKATYEQILNKDPGDADARAGLENLGSVVKAVEKAVVKEVRRKEVPDLLAKGTIDMVHERYTDALESFHAVLQLEPGNAEAKEQINEVQRLMKGRKLYVPPVNVQSAADDKYREGLKLYGNEQYSEAEAAFEEALKIDPHHDDARQALKRLKERETKP
jgi:tetratricopeptide (TPR) repeat protein